VGKIFIIELCNFEDYPTGGHLSFAKQMLKAFDSQIALIGISTSSEPIKKWIKKEIDGIEYDFFSVKKLYKDFKKPIIPNRLKAFYYLSKCRKELKFLENENVFIQTPEVLFAIRNWGIKNICFRSPGVVNMLVSSRFWYAKYFKDIFEILFFNNLQKVSMILVSADRNSIMDFCKRSKNRIHAHQVVQFPTRIDTDIFKPVERSIARTKLNLGSKRKIIVTTGRLGSFKGWKFMIDCYELFKVSCADSHFYFIGDGEDRYRIENYISEKKLRSNAFILGKLDPQTIALYLSACDLYIMGSYIEGWSTSLMEAIACARPVCVTNFGSAVDMVENGKNGYVVLEHNQNEFVEKMYLSLKLDDHELIKKSKYFSRFSLNNLKDDLLYHWTLT
jgi:glycosyltransferase involved in cell wall biosynthesis